MSKAQAMEEPAATEERITRITWVTAREFMVAVQDNTGNLKFTDATEPIYPRESLCKVFTDEKISDAGELGNYFMPAYEPYGQAVASPYLYHSKRKERINNIEMNRVYRSVIRKIIKPFDGNTVGIFVYNANTRQTAFIQLSTYYEGNFSYKLRPRVMLTAAQYANLITGFDSSDALVNGIAAKLDLISHKYTLEPELTYEYPVIPKMTLLPAHYANANDANYPYVILPTLYVMEIDYYWR